jgi:CRP-like cAMP-binding protein
VSRSNFILARLTDEELGALSPHLSVVKLIFGEVIAETHERVRRVYFPHSGIISCVVDLAGGGAIETGMIGKDGVCGALQALDDKISLNRIVVQVAGEASVIDSDRLRDFALNSPNLRKVLVKYDLLFMAQVQQTAACNAVHNVRQRLCRWLLRMHDLQGPNLELTQEFLAQMMGVRRTSVTDVAKELQKAGLISYTRGKIHISDVDLVKAWACECEEDLRMHHKHIFDPPPSEAF